MSVLSSVPFCSTEIRFMTSEDLQKHLLSLTLKNVVLLLTDNGEKRWGLSSFVSRIKESTASFIRITDIPSNPTSEDIANAVNCIGSNPVDVILTVGGGSCIDLAKGISAFYPQSAPVSSAAVLSQIQDNSYLSCKGVDIIAVPTTAGTGSEVTQWATVWDKVEKKKYSLDCPQLKPKAAYIVPEYTLSLPAELTLSTGLDALSHAVEAYWSRHTTPLVQDIAYRAIELIVSYLRQVIDSPDDLSLREKICRASLLAGLAFSQTRTTACHAISYPLTMYYDVPHGFAVALSLAGVAEINRGHFPNDSELFGLFEEWGGIRGWLDFVCQDIVKLDIQGYHISDYSLIISDACGNGRMSNNPRDISPDYVRKMFSGDNNYLNSNNIKGDWTV